MCICICGMHMHVQARGQCQVSFSMALHLIFLAKVSHRTWNSLVPVKLASGFHPALPPPTHRQTPVHLAFMQCTESKLRSSWTHSRRLLHWLISPALYGLRSQSWFTLTYYSGLCRIYSNDPKAGTILPVTHRPVTQWHGHAGEQVWLCTFSSYLLGTPTIGSSTGVQIPRPDK